MKHLRASLVAVFIATGFNALSAQDSQSDSSFARIRWANGPAVGQLGKVAEVAIPAGCRFTDAEGARQFMEATENTVNGDEQGVLLCENLTADSSAWFVVFTYEESGFVKDDEKSSLDSAALLKTLQRGTESGNNERRRRGWEELEIVGWQRAPYYDAITNNLTWSTRVRAKGTTDESINHSVRLLGRGGVMNADLVADPEEAVSAVATFDTILKDFSYTAGNRYAEWREGDKVAEYGLTALIAGGAGVAAVKLGLFGKLWKFLVVAFLALKKALIVAVIAIAGFVKRLFSKKRPTTSAPSGGGSASV